TVLIVVWALAFVGLLLAGAFALAQTGFGQRVIAAQLSRALSDAGTTVEVRGLGGLIPFDFRIEQVRLADGEGTWLELDQFRLSASPRALLHGRLEVDEVGAQRLALHRLPPGEDPEVPPADEAEEVAETAPLPELPSSLPPVSVRSLAIERLEVGEAVLGRSEERRVGEEWRARG